TEPEPILVKPPAPEIVPLRNREPLPPRNVSELRRMLPVQTHVPLQLKSPALLTALIVRASLVTWTLFKNRLASPLMIVPTEPPRMVVVAPRARSAEMASWP